MTIQAAALRCLSSVRRRAAFRGPRPVRVLPVWLSRALDMGYDHGQGLYRG